MQLRSVDESKPFQKKFKRIKYYIQIYIYCKSTTCKNGEILITNFRKKEEEIIV